MKILITVLGLSAGALTSLAFLPQVIKAFKTGQTEDLSLPMILVQLVGTALWIVYGIIITNWPIILTNSAEFLFTLLLLVIKLKKG